jgi:uncharacterized protein
MGITCPRCGKETLQKGNPFRPFCSERCKLIDLGDWITGKYGIATPLGEEEDLPDDSADDLTSPTDDHDR